MIIVAKLLNVVTVDLDIVVMEPIKINVNSVLII